MYTMVSVMKLLLGIFLIHALSPLANSNRPSDYCSDQFDSYTFNAINLRKKWKASIAKCQNKGGCLARPYNRTILRKIRDAIKHTGFRYWVGIKYDKEAKQLLWDDSQPVHLSAEFNETVNLKEIYDASRNHYHGNDKKCRDFCLVTVITDEKQKLEPENCDINRTFVCQIPENPPISYPATSATTPTRKQASSTSTQKTTASTQKTTASTQKTRPTESTTEKTHSSTERMSKATARPKTDTDRKVNDFLEKMKKVKVEDLDSMKSAMTMTSSLMKSLGKDVKAKGNIMKVAKEMEKFCMKYAKLHLKPNESRIEKGDSFLIELRKVVDKKKVIFPSKCQQSSVCRTSINLPASLLDEERVIMSALYEDVTDYIPLISDDNKKKQEIISPVISSTLDPKPDGVFEDNITITIQHYKRPSKFQPSCVFWHTSVENEMNGVWSSDGCTVKDTDDNQTICSCNHLTSFALLMQVDENPSDVEAHKMALSYITYIGCGFSLLGEILTILAYAFLMNMKQEQSQIRVNLSVSLGVAQIFFLSGITATSNLGVCTFIAVMLHFFYLVAFGWMMLEGVYLYLMVVKVFNTIIKMRLYYIVAWGFPLIVVGISLIIASTLEDGINSYTNQNFCWVSFSNGLVWSFVGPVLLVLLVNIIILFRVVREMIRLNRAKMEDAKNIRRGVKACVVLFPLLGLTWLFGLLAVTKAGLVFQYVFTVLNAFQGFFIFVFHCLRSGEIRASFKRRVERWELTRPSNFNTNSKSIDQSHSASDKNALKFVSSDSLQDNFPRPNRVNPANADDKSVCTCITPVEIGPLNQSLTNAFI